MSAPVLRTAVLAVAAATALAGCQTLKPKAKPAASETEDSEEATDEAASETTESTEA